MSEELSTIAGAGGGGGCFRKGTQVQLENGKTIAIELLKVGDEVLAFDEQGKIHVSKVTKVHFHEKPEPILRVKFWKGETHITPNHWVLNQYDAFAEISRLTYHDALVDGMGHLRPITLAEYVGNEPVWNLTVEPHHTFIADGIRVHNGGHRDRFPTVAGAGGGGGGKSEGRQAIEDPDSLQSKALISIVDVIGEGEIGGLEDSAKSILLNGTPLMNANGTMNFKNVSWTFRNGTQNQLPMKNYVDAATPRSIGVQVKYGAPSVFSVTNPDVDEVNVVVTMPSLFKQDKSTGDIHGTSVQYQFAVKADNGAFVNYGPPVTVTGKTSGKYQRATKIVLPKPAGRWDIRMTRITPDAPDSSIANVTHLDSIVEVVKSRLNYPNTAIVGLTIDSSQFSQVPTRSYKIKGIKIKVPSNYDPVTRVYSGIWDGSFKNAVSSNPAWIMYDLLTSKRYGLGEYISQNQVSKASLYSIGRYCDEMVPGEDGVDEPRFQINTQIQSQQEAYKLLSDISSAFRGMSYWSGGVVGFTQDCPQDPSMVFSPSNVIDGLFNYVGASRKDRHSVVMVTWNDPKQDYKQAVEYVESPELISQLGVRSVETVAFGCTSRTQARRVGLWILYTERYESSVVNFSVGPEASMLMPGEVAQINDPSKAGRRMAGRLASCTLNSATLDSEVEIKDAEANISIRMPDGSFEDRTVLEGPGKYTSLTWTSPLPSEPVANAIFIVSEANLKPLLVRIVSVAENYGEGKGTYSITAIEHNPGKYAEIERDAPHEIRYVSDMQLVPEPPTGLVTVDSIFKSGASILSRLSVSWDSDDKSIASWTVRIRSQNDSNWEARDNITIPSVDFDNVTDGESYIVEVYSVNPLGNRSSTPAVTTHTVLGKKLPPSDVTGFESRAAGNRMLFTWDNAKDVDLKEYEVRRDDIGWGDEDPAVLVYRGAANSFSVEETDGAATDSTLYIKAVDTSGNFSENASLVNVTFVRPTTPVIRLKISDTSTVSATASLEWNPSTSDFAVSQYEVTVSKPGVASEVFTQSNTSFQLDMDFVGSATISVVAVDAHGKRSNSGFKTVESLMPAAPTSFQFLPAEVGTLKLVWAEANRTTLAVAGYEVRDVDANWGAFGAIHKGSVPMCTLNNISVGDNTFYVRSFDTEGRYSSSMVATYTYTGPSMVGVIGHSVSDSAVTSASVRFSWFEATSPFGVDRYVATLTKPDVIEPVVYTTRSNEWVTNIDWIGDATIEIAAYDNAGNITSAPITKVVSRARPNPITAVDTNLVSYANGKVTLSFEWSDVGLETTLPIAGFEIRKTDSNFGKSGFAYRGASAVAQIAGIPTNADVNYYVRPYDTEGTYSDTSFNIFVGRNIGPEPVTDITSVPYGQLLRIKWKAPLTTGGEVRYELRWNDANWGVDDANRIYYGSNLYADVRLANLGSNKVYIRVLDQFFQWSVTTNHEYIYSIADPVGFTYQFGTATSPQIILKWNAAAPAFGLSEYVLTSDVDSITLKATTKTLPATWDGSRAFTLKVKDNNGNLSNPVTITADIAPPVNSTVMPTYKLSAVKNNLATIVINWTDATKGALPIKGYEVRDTDSGWGTGGAIYDGVQSACTITNVPMNTTSTWYLRAYDVSKNYAATSYVIENDGLTPPSQLTGLYGIAEGTGYRLNWDQATDIDVVEYEVRTSDSNWGLAGQVYRGIQATCLIAKPPVAGTTYYLRAKDAYGQRSIATTLVFTYPTPDPVSDIFFNFVDAAGTMLIDWPTATPDFRLKNYKLSYMEDATLKTVTTAASSVTIKPNWFGDREYKVVVVDTYGVESSATARTVTVAKPGSVTSPAASVVSIKAGNQTIKIDWPDAAKGSFNIAGYEIRTADSGWGTAGYKYKGAASQATLSSVSTTAATTWYLKAYDGLGNYSQTATALTYNPVLPNEVTSVTVKRVKAVLEISSVTTVKPADFSCVQYRIAKVMPGSTSGDDTGIDEGVISTGDFWNDPDCLIYNGTETSDKIRVNISDFPKPLFSKTGITYRIAARVMDKGGNFSPNSAMTSIVVAAL